jgi:apolipoprotein N-acyltransferase
MFSPVKKFKDLLKDKVAVLWLTGTTVSLFAVHTNWDVPLAAWVYPVLLLRYCRLRPARHGILRVGAAVMTGLLFWLTVTGMLFVPIAAATFMLLALMLTVPFALDRLFAPRLSGIWATLLFPASRVAMEYLFGFVGFGNWGTLGVTQHGNLLLIQLTALTGVYGVSFLIAWFASLINQAWEADFRWAVIRSEALTYAGVLLLVLCGGAVRMHLSTTSSRTVVVSGVSANNESTDATRRLLEQAVPQYWRPANVALGDPGRVRQAFSPVDEDLIARTKQEARAGAKIVLWPETQAKLLEQDLTPFMSRIQHITIERKVFVDVAFALYTRQPPYIRNVAALVTPEGTIAWTYDKTHPTPMELMLPGPGVVPVVDSSYGHLANVICYDADYPGLMRQAALKGADLMLVPAFDWKGFEYLHAENAVFPAVENGYAILRQSKDGVSTAIDSHGRVLKSVNYFTAEDPNLVTQIPLQTGIRTIYSKVGDAFAWICLAGTLLLFMKAIRSRGQFR